VGSTTFRLGLKIVVPGVAFDVLRPEPDVRSNSVRFVQTVGGRAGFPAPRRVSGKPFFRIHSATAWTTLGLTIGLDGTSFSELLGASAFPRHWVYDNEGTLVKKSGTVDFKTWYREAHGENTPWGEEESDAFVTNAESALEREMSRELMTSGIDMARRSLEPGDTLVQQGEHGDDLFLLVDGVLAVIVDGDEVGEIGPGAIVGELASLEGGKRTATLTARTPCRVAVIPAELVDLQEREDLAVGRR